MYGHLSCLYVAVKLCATHGVLPDKHQVSLPPQTVLLRIGFTFAQSRQCAGELLPRLSILTSYEAVYFCCTFPEVALGGRYPLSCPMEPGLSSRYYLSA